MLFWMTVQASGYTSSCAVTLRPSQAFTALAADYTTGSVPSGLANEWASIRLRIVAPTAVSIAEIRQWRRPLRRIHIQKPLSSPEPATDDQAYANAKRSK